MLCGVRNTRNSIAPGVDWILRQMHTVRVQHEPTSASRACWVTFKCPSLGPYFYKSCTIQDPLLSTFLFHYFHRYLFVQSEVVCEILGSRGGENIDNCLLGLWPRVDLLWVFIPSSDLQLTAVDVPEMLVSVYKSTQLYSPEDRHRSLKFCF